MINQKGAFWPLFSFPKITITAYNVKNKTVPYNGELPSEETLLGILREKKAPLRTDILLKICSLPKNARKDLEKLLFTLKDKSEVERLPGGRWSLPDILNFKSGKFVARPIGGGFVIPDDGSEEIQINAFRTKGAWHKDKVRVLLLPGNEGGKIVEILEKQQKEVVARVDKCKGNSILCHPTDRKLNIKFRVHLDDPAICKKQIRPGSLILIKPEKAMQRDEWEASLLNIFGAENSITVQENIVKCNHHVPSEFPDLALDQAEKLDKLPMDINGREDLRHMPFVTIDGADAKDFDDAIYVEKSADGWILRVAIADVSHYVHPDERQGSLDAEALKRANSWYFPQSVEPMLPKILSNGLCSLRPNEDRLALMAEIYFSKDGLPLKSRFAPIVMRSQGRLTYDSVANFFENGLSKPQTLHEGETPINKNTAKMLEEAFNLFKVIAERRRKDGTLDFDLPEPKYKFDDKGQLLEMSVAQHNDAHKLIEEFMIAANEAVATYLASTSIPFLYRVHPKPDSQKIAALFETLDLTGIDSLPADKRKTLNISPSLIQDILKRAYDSPHEYIVNKLCLRSMQQARYQPVNEGHFGLASEAYCHFTSPIRRYADLLVHRALKSALGQNKEKTPDKEKLNEIGDSLNKLEREALECEREIARRMGCLALNELTGQSLKGTISGLTDFGVFVEFKDIPTEGLIRLSDLGDDWYEYDQKRQQLVGQHEGKIWRLGQPLKVKVESVDLDRLEIRLRPEGLEAAKHKNMSDERKARKSFQNKKRSLPRVKSKRPDKPEEYETLEQEKRSERGRKTIKNSKRRKA